MQLTKLYNSTGTILVAFSGGKDSIAMVLYLLEMGIPPERIHLHHHQVDGKGECLFDWACTESYCQAFATQFGLKLFFSYRNGGIIREIYRVTEAKQDVYYQREVGGPYFVAPSNKTKIGTRLKFPGVSASLAVRWCSATVKIDVLRTAIAHNPNYLGEIFILTGERRQESPNRAKYAMWEVHHTNCKKRSAIGWRPILDWTEEEVWSIMERWKVQPHPAYMLGWSRCSCQLCIFNHADIWATVERISPKKVSRLEAIENEIGFTVYNRHTIKDKIASGSPLDVNSLWVEQGTGIFTVPIITENWILPKGAFRNVPAGAF